MRPRRRGWLTLLTAIGLIAVAGSGLTRIFPPTLVDAVSNAEAAERAEAFTRQTPLRLAVVPPARTDVVVLDMRLEPAQQQALKKALADAELQQAASVGRSVTTQAVVVPVNLGAAEAVVERAASVLRLVELTLWDTHAPDGDVVRISSAGYARDVLLAKTEQTIVLPVADGALVQITGVRDGGGGITLGLRGPDQQLLLPIISEGQSLSLPVRP